MYFLLLPFMKIGRGFIFSSVTLADVAKEVNILNSSKAIQEANLPLKLLMDNKHFFAAYIAKYFNDSLKNAKFPNYLKLVSAVNYCSFQEKCTHI